MAGGIAPKSSRDPKGDPDWWLSVLVTDMLMRLPILETRGAYVEGRHPLPLEDRKYARAWRKFQNMCSTNYCGLVTNASVQRMDVRGFRFGDGEGLDQDARTIWNANDMDTQSFTINNYAAKYGLGYALVAPPELDYNGEEEDNPCITALDPRSTIIYRDPRRPSRAMAGLRMWTDDLEGQVLAVLYTPDGIYGYEGPDSSILEGMTLRGIRNMLLGLNGGPGAFILSEHTDNEIGEVPLVEFVWRPETGKIPEGEAGLDVRIIQDRCNQTVFDRVVITSTQAFKQRYASGIKIPKGKKGRAEAPFDPGADRLWVTEDPEVKFGEFTAADVGQVLEAIREDIIDIAAITQTPPHYLMGKISNVSGETLAQAETGLTKKIKQRQKSMGWSYERMMKLAFAYQGNEDKSTNVDAQVVWNDPEQNALTDQAAAAAQFIASGIPASVVMERVGGFTEEQIAFTQEQIELQQQRDEQMMQQQLEAGQDQFDQGHGLAQKAQKDSHEEGMANVAVKKAQAMTAKQNNNGGGNPRPSSATTRKAASKTATKKPKPK